MTIKVTQVIEMEIPAVLQGEDLVEFREQMRGLPFSGEHVTLKLKFENGAHAAGYGRVTVPTTEPDPGDDWYPTPGTEEPEPVVEPGGVHFKGRAELSVKKPTESHTLNAERIEGLLKDRTILPRELRFNQGFLRAFIAREDMDQGTFGDLVGVTGCTVSNWCSGVTRPLVPNLRAVSEATGLSMDKLLLESVRS
jgi:hypothetical protein